MKKKEYNRICATISDANREDLDNYVKKHKRRIKSTNISSVVDRALALFFRVEKNLPLVENVQNLNMEDNKNGNKFSNKE